MLPCLSVQVVIPQSALIEAPRDLGYRLVVYRPLDEVAEQLDWIYSIKYPASDLEACRQVSLYKKGAEASLAQFFYYSLAEELCF